MIRPIVLASIAILLAVGSISCGGDEAQIGHVAPLDPNRSDAERTTPTPNQPAKPPIVESVSLYPDEPTSGDSLSARIKVDDQDSGPFRVVYSWWINGRKSPDSGSTLMLSDVSRGHRVEVSVVAVSDHGTSEPMTDTVTLGNSPPIVSSIRFEPSGDWLAGRSVAAIPEANDADGDPLKFEYTWYHNDRILDEHGPRIDGSKLKRGDRIQLVVIASDGQAESDLRRSDDIKVQNSVPEIQSEPGAIASDGIFRYQIRVSDPDGDRSFTYKLISGPAGMKIDSFGGLMTWTPEPAQAGTHAIAFEVKDPMGGRTTQKFDLPVSFGSPAAPALP